ncbi:hypothetical protein EVG20_g1905 [Dentipellis fragilis]|uniref:Uncharacterized protein n=1 Tax=Dentipellis fragilis TaxID=205917 RepID=A0A4Y9ZCG9_9AGAM|nr:hypothetical protein EVG20_g1905 [Dentipellis fragilis]
MSTFALREHSLSASTHSLRALALHEHALCEHAIAHPWALVSLFVCICLHPPERAEAPQRESSSPVNELHALSGEFFVDLFYVLIDELRALSVIRVVSIILNNIPSIIISFMSTHESTQPTGSGQGSGQSQHTFEGQAADTTTLAAFNQDVISTCQTIVQKQLRSTSTCLKSLPKGRRLLSLTDNSLQPIRIPSTPLSKLHSRITVDFYDDDDDNNGDNVEGGYSRKRVEIDLSELPWVQEESSAGPLDDHLEEMRCLLTKFSADPKLVRSSIVNARNCPQFPESEWTNIIAGHAVNLDHVLSELYNVSVENKHRERLGAIEFSVGTVAPAKTVRSHGKWIIAWERTSEVTSFVFPHRRAELIKYCAHISQFFVVITPANHEQVLAYEKAVRIRVAARRDLKLTDINSFADLQTLITLEETPLAPRDVRPVATGMKDDARIRPENAPTHTFARNVDPLATRLAPAASISSQSHPIDNPRYHPDWSLTASPLPGPPLNEFMNTAAQDTLNKHPDLFKIVTPINVDKFENMLRTHPNQPFVASVCRGLREGFWPSADMSNPDYPSTWDNSKCSLASDQHRVFVEEQCRKEIEIGHFSEAWEAEQLYPGMYSMPIGVVPKPNSDKLRLITDHSAGKFSLNSMIDKPNHDNKVQLDNVRDLGFNLLWVRRSNTGAALTLFKSDVAEAYRLMPMHPSWQIRQVVSIGTKRMVDRCNVFGGRRSGNIWCVFMSLVLWIAVYIKHIRDLLGYSDDMFSWEYLNNVTWYPPYRRFLPHKQFELLSLWDELDIPHHSEKQIHGSPIPIIGFEVDVNKMLITLSEDRRIALISKLREFVGSSGPRHRRPLRCFQALAGWVQWALNVYPLLRPGLSVMYDKMRGKANPHALIEVSVTLRCELTWLADHVENSSGIFMLHQEKSTYTCRTTWPV